MHFRLLGHPSEQIEEVAQEVLGNDFKSVDKTGLSVYSPNGKSSSTHNPGGFPVIQLNRRPSMEKQRELQAKLKAVVTFCS